MLLEPNFLASLETYEADDLALDPLGSRTSAVAPERIQGCFWGLWTCVISQSMITESDSTCQRTKEKTLRKERERQIGAPSQGAKFRFCESLAQPARIIFPIIELREL